jgi:hypothetical protein
MTDTDTLTDDLATWREAKEAYDKAKAALAKDGEKVVALWLQDLLARNPVVKAVQFTAYTPYFNDGDPCVWGLGEIYVGIPADLPENAEASYNLNEEVRWDFRDDDDYEDETDSINGLNYYSGWSAPESLKEQVKAVTNEIESTEDLIRDGLPDHIRVVVTEKGMTIEDYDHD